MKNSRTFLLVTAILGIISLLVSCNDIKRDNGVIEAEPKMAPCFQPHNLTDEWVVRTQAEYDSLLATTSCTSAPETINFDAYTLLGKYTPADCKPRYYRQVLRNDDDQRIVFKVLVKSRKGWCKKQAYSYNWVLVPKFPESYAVTFEVLD